MSQNTAPASTGLHSPTPRWIVVTLQAAGVYNLAWGAWVVFWPLAFFQWIGIEPPRYPEIWQCVGMIVGVYGIGYWIAAKDPNRHWPIVFVGLLGKFLGPIGMANAIVSGRLPVIAGITCVFNDLIWWVPFAIILRRAYRSQRALDQVSSTPSNCSQ